MAGLWSVGVWAVGAVWATTVGAAALPEPTGLVRLQGADACTRCAGVLLPGSLEALPEAAYRVDSDLPEIFLSTGLLYSTRAVLPAFDGKDGTPISDAQRTQRNAGFDAIDRDFEVFVYHMSNPGTEPRVRRVLVAATNEGDRPVRVRPRQIMESPGKMASHDGPESRLTVRMLDDAWDALPEREIGPGQTRVIAWGPRLSVAGAAADDPVDDADASPSDFFTGMVRAEVDDADAQLRVDVVAIDGAVPPESFDAAAAEMMDRGAWSGEGAMDLNIAPPECHVRRVVGVSPGVLWRSADVVLDISALPPERMIDGGPAGLGFLMAAPAVQTVGCPDAQQTTPMLLHPGYVHADTVGNYQVEYLLTLTLTNPSAVDRAVDLRFGKQDADIGLAWQAAVGASPASREELAATPARVGWAGGWRTGDLADNTRSFLTDEPEGPDHAWPSRVVVPAGGLRVVSLRCMVVGTSSLPWYLHVVPME